MKERVILWLVWKVLPRSIVHWAFVRVAVYECPDNPGARTCGEALQTWANAYGKDGAIPKV